MRHVYIVGAKGVGQYGGYETFVQKLLEYSNGIKFHVACKANGDGHMDIDRLPGAKKIGEKSFEYKRADCFLVDVLEVGSAQAIFYDVKAIKECIRKIKEDRVESPIVYVLACRIGPFFFPLVKSIHKLGGKVYVNPDGHEWKRAKWSKPIREYWKYSEKLMVKHADLLICDSKNIEKYIQEEYAQSSPKTTYIAYGAEIKESTADDSEWLRSKGLEKDKYYLVVGRFVPENNYETMIREFMKSNVQKNFAIITNVNDKFLSELDERTGYSKDNRIKFVGTVYDEQLLKKIREDAYGYFHGHEVGGTNPSLLEALGSTKLNLLLDVGFNREVAEDSALYWTKEDRNLKSLIEQCEDVDREELGIKAKERIKTAFSWDFISKEYEKVFEI